MPGKQNEEDEEKNEDDNNDWEDSWDGNKNKIIWTSISKKNSVSDWEKSEVSDNVNANTQLITHFTSNFIP